MQTVTVLGGTGFLGRRVVRHLLEGHFSVRAASRHPDRSRFSSEVHVEAVRADVRDDGSILTAIRDAFAVVNAISLYVERGRDTFHSIHVETAERVATLARQSGVQRLVHISGIGSDSQSASSYIRSRGRGEDVVRQAFPDATIIRPAVMFGPDDAFVMPLRKMLEALPVFPMFGRGQTRLQPACVEDVAEAITRVLRSANAAPVYELAGPRIYTYEALLRTIAASTGKAPVLLPFPFFLWRALAGVLQFLPSPPIARNQVELMQADTVESADVPGFDDLQISPQPMEKMLSPV